MPVCNRNENLETYYFDQLHKQMFKFKREGTDVYASEVDGGCLQKTIFRRRFEPPPSKQQLLKFMRGFAVEMYITSDKKRQDPRPPELEHRIWEDIRCGIDDFTEYGISEIKSTAKSCSTFMPLESYPWWIERGGIYCLAWDETKFNLVCNFVRGNYKDIQEEFKCYEIKFSTTELFACKDRVLDRAQVLRQALKNNSDIPLRAIQPLKFSGNKTECSWCESADLCDYKDAIPK